jgi:hypothetical protein
MGFVGNMTAAGTLQTAGNTRKGNKVAQQAAFDAATRDQALFNELATNNALLREANQHAVALVNEQMKTNQLLTELLRRLGTGS